MPTVRAYGQRKVQSGALPSARLPVNKDPNAYGAGLGNVVSRLGSQVLDEIAEKRAEQARKERQRMDEIAVISARNKLDGFENELMYGEQGLMRRKGEDAFGAYDGFEATYNKKADELEGTLANEDQKLAFLRARSSRFDSASGKLRQHIAAESEKFDAQESNKLLENITQDAVRSFMSPRAVSVKLGEADVAVRAYADRNGLGKEQTEAMLRNVKSNIHEGVLDNLLADEMNVAGAQEYFAAVKDQIAADKLDNIEKALKTGSIRKQSQEEADKIAATAQTQTEALEMVRQIENPELRDETEQRVVREFQRRKQAEQLDTEDAMTQAGNILDRTNGNIQAIPARMWEQFTPSQKASLKAYSKREDTGGTGTGASGLGQWMRLMEESVSNPEAFKARDLTKFMGSMPKTELKELQRQQLEMRQGKTPKGVDDFRTADQVITGAITGVIDSKKNPEGKAKVTQRVAEMSQDVIRRTGKAPTNAELETFANKAVSEEVLIKRSEVWDFNPFNNSDVKVPVINLKVTDIPASARRRIEGKLRQLGMQVSDREVMRLFVAESRVQ